MRRRRQILPAAALALALVMLTLSGSALSSQTALDTGSAQDEQVEFVK